MQLPRNKEMLYFMDLLRDLGKREDTRQGSRGQPFRFVTPFDFD